MKGTGTTVQVSIYLAPTFAAPELHERAVTEEQKETSRPAERRPRSSRSSTSPRKRRTTASRSSSNSPLAGNTRSATSRSPSASSSRTQVRRRSRSSRVPRGGRYPGPGAGAQPLLHRHQPITLPVPRSAHGPRGSAAHGDDDQTGCLHEGVRSDHVVRRRLELHDPVARHQTVIAAVRRPAGLRSSRRCTTSSTGSSTGFRPVLIGDPTCSPWPPDVRRGRGPGRVDPDRHALALPAGLRSRRARMRRRTHD